MPALHETIDTVREILDYPTYDVSCQLVDEDYMKEINSDTLGMEKSTDVLSFCFTEYVVEQGVLKEVPSQGKMIGEMYCLGEMSVCVDYVANRCEEDRKSGFLIGKSKIVVQWKVKL
jgi:ssRNA-specific RNase YbeY (16S rRNA maturation enzyme)